MSPKQVKITPGSLRERDAVVDAAHRDHAHRAARAVHQLDVRGQQVVDAVLVDRVRVAAAHLHHLVVAAGLDRGEDLARHRAAQLGVAELVDEPHAAASSRASAVPACTSSVGRPACASTRPISTVLRAPVLVLAQREAARLVDPQHPHRDPVVAARDAVAGRVEAGAEGLGHQNTSLIRSRSPSAPRAPARSRRPLPRAAAASRAPPPRRPSRARSRRGSGPSRRARRASPSESSRPMLTLRRTPATSTRARRLASSTISTICPGIARHTSRSSLKSREGASAPAGGSAPLPVRYITF